MDPGNDMDRETADVERVDGVVAAIKRGALAEAESLLTEVIQHAPGEYRLVERIGFQLFIKFWDVEAFTHYVTWTRGQDQGAEGQQKGADMVVWLKSVYRRAFYLLGFLMIRTGQFERAIGFLDRGLFLEPSNPAFAIEKAVALARLGRHGEALESLEALVAVDAFVSERHLAAGLRGRGFIFVEINDRKILGYQHLWVLKAHLDDQEPFAQMRKAS